MAHAVYVMALQAEKNMKEVHKYIISEELCSREVRPAFVTTAARAA